MPFKAHIFHSSLHTPNTRTHIYESNADIRYVLLSETVSYGHESLFGCVSICTPQQFLSYCKLNSILKRICRLLLLPLRLQRALATLVSFLSLFIFLFSSVRIAFVCVRECVCCSVFCFGFFILCAVFFVDLFSLYVLLTLSA